MAGLSLEEDSVVRIDNVMASSSNLTDLAISYNDRCIDLHSGLSIDFLKVWLNDQFIRQNWLRKSESEIKHK